MKEKHQRDRFAQAILLAMIVHEGQVDAAGESYILHPLRVAMAMLPDYKAATVGVLHDVLEDCPPGQFFALSQEMLIRFGRDVTGACLALWRNGEPYALAIERLTWEWNDLARSVKLEDLADNLQIDRLAGAQRNGADVARLVRKYARALATLQNFEWSPE